MRLKAIDRVLILLIAFTFLAIFSYRSGFLDTSLSIIDEGKHNYELLPAIVTGSVKEELTQTSTSLDVSCVLENVDTFRLCGIGMDLSHGATNTGVDVSQYDTLEINVSYKAPISDSQIRVSLRNYHPTYSSLEDEVSLKFNSITFKPSNYNNNVEIPLDAFQVENWWVEQYNIGFDDSQTDFSNISRLEILAHNMPTDGVYAIKANKLVLRGKLISANSLFKLTLFIWLFAGFLLLLKQHNVLKKMSNQDVLTGLYNRRGILRIFRKTLQNNDIFLFYLDINEFKKINDTYGQIVGDELLIYLSRFLEEKAKSFKGEVHLSRFSGDEFILLFTQMSELGMKSIAESIISGLEAPIKVARYKLSVRVSLGIAKEPKTYTSFDALLSHANVAMQLVKNNKQHAYQVFDDSISDNIYFKQNVSEYVKEALFKGEFHLNYMPIYATKSLEMTAVEVLIRSHSEKLKGVGPDVFIPVAEEYNLIQALDLWVIENTFKHIKEEFHFLSKKPIVFCINISAEELKNKTFQEKLKQLLDKYRIPPEWIKLELTETSFVKIDKNSIAVLENIRSLGVKLSLDDFGTGYISFNQLVNYPVHTLKVDKSFIDPLGYRNKPSERLVQAILSMADAYQLDTVAEGVETQLQYQYLLHSGCDAVQGYLFSKPLPWDVFKKHLFEPNTDQLKRSALPPF